jgi:hypothetical protein
MFGFIGRSEQFNTGLHLRVECPGGGNDGEADLLPVTIYIKPLAVIRASRRFTLDGDREADGRFCRIL